MFFGMARPRLVLVVGIAVVLCIAEARPQFGDDGPPIRRYRQSDNRHILEVMQQSTSGQPIRPFTQADVREEGREVSQSLPVRPFNQREREPEVLPVRPFDQYDTRGTSGGSSARVVPPPSSQPVRPFSQGDSARDQGGRHTPREQSPRREDDPNQSRAHAAPLNPRITLQSDQKRQQQQQQRGQHQHHGMQHTATSQRNDETPHWSTGQVRLDSGSSNSHHSPSPTLHRDNRRTIPQEQGKVSSRVEQSQKGGGSSVRMGSATKGADDALEQGKSDGTQEVIVFPGPTKEPNKGRFAPQVGTIGPNCAKGSTFCESTDNYPADHLKVVLRKEGDTLKEFFGNDLLLNDTSISQRIDSVDENPLCQSVEQVVYPKVAQNKEDKWLYVVNQDQYIQGVRVEKCLKPESECLLTKSFPLGYKTICRQKYIYRRLVALNDDGKTHSDTFRLPSCCSCFVKSVSGAESRR